ncbi:hypothetical protein [Acidovorax lacteus]|uniref:Uncharacterized protein n=1 Tax=Acidovorax lacteus TaxID=1924988 RepID=A0ABP8L057_9BURK
MPTAPPPVQALPAAPDPNDRTTFNNRAYPWSLAQAQLRTDLTALAANVFNNAVEAEASATTATAQAAAAIAAVGAPMWVAGTYAVGVVVWSPADLQSYRRRTSGASAIDPQLDATGWTRISGGDPVPQYLIHNTGVI